MVMISSSIPPISEELFSHLVEVFGRPLEVEPNITTMDEVMYRGGQRSVIEWIRAKALYKPIITGPTTVDVDIRDHRTS